MNENSYETIERIRSAWNVMLAAVVMSLFFLLLSIYDWALNGRAVNEPGVASVIAALLAFMMGWRTGTLKRRAGLAE